MPRSSSTLDAALAALTASEVQELQEDHRALQEDWDNRSLDPLPASGVRGAGRLVSRLLMAVAGLEARPLVRQRIREDLERRVGRPRSERPKSLALAMHEAIVSGLARERGGRPIEASETPALFRAGLDIEGYLALRDCGVMLALTVRGDYLEEARSRTVESWPVRLVRLLRLGGDHHRPPRLLGEAEIPKSLSQGNMEAYIRTMLGNATKNEAREMARVRAGGDAAGIGYSPTPEDERREVAEADVYDEGEAAIWQRVARLLLDRDKPRSTSLLPHPRLKGSRAKRLGAWANEMADPKSSLGRDLRIGQRVYASKAPPWGAASKVIVCIQAHLKLKGGHKDEKTIREDLQKLRDLFLDHALVAATVCGALAVFGVPGSAWAGPPEASGESPRRVPSRWWAAAILAPLGAAGLVVMPRCGDTRPASSRLSEALPATASTRTESKPSNSEKLESLPRTTEPGDASGFDPFAANGKLMIMSRPPDGLVVLPAFSAPSPHQARRADAYCISLVGSLDLRQFQPGGCYRDEASCQRARKNLADSKGWWTPGSPQPAMSCLPVAFASDASGMSIECSCPPVTRSPTEGGQPGTVSMSATLFEPYCHFTNTSGLPVLRTLGRTGRSRGYKRGEEESSRHSVIVNIDQMGMGRPEVPLDVLANGLQVDFSKDAQVFADEWWVSVAAAAEDDAKATLRIWPLRFSITGALLPLLWEGECPIEQTRTEE